MSADSKANVEKIILKKRLLRLNQCEGLLQYSKTKVDKTTCSEARLKVTAGASNLELRWRLWLQ